MINRPRRRRLAAALGSVAVALIAGAASADTGAYPLARLWIDDPLAASVLEAGAVPVQVHGNDPAVPLQLFVDGQRVAVTAHPSADGRLTTATFSWAAVTGRHELVTKEGSLESAPADVWVVPAPPSPAPGDPSPPSVSPPSTSTPPVSTTPASTAPHPAPPASSRSTSPRSTSPRSTSPEPSSSQRSPSKPPSSKRTPTTTPVSPSPGPSPSVTPTTPPAVKAPQITSVEIDPRSVAVGDGCRGDRDFAVDVRADDTTTVSLSFSEGSTVQITRALTHIDGRWTAVIDGGDVPHKDGDPTSVAYEVHIAAIGPGGTTDDDAGSVSASRASCLH